MEVNYQEQRLARKRHFGTLHFLRHACIWFSVTNVAGHTFPAQCLTCLICGKETL
jgi:hypothetical protein